MSKISGLIRRMACDEQGGELMEYALICGLIVCAAMAVIATVGTKVLANWSSLNTQTGN